MKGTVIKTTDVAPHLKTIPPNANIPWKAFPADKESIKIPGRTGQAKELEKLICLRVNHFPLNIKLPANIFHYVVEMTKVKDENKPSKSTGKSSKPTDEPEKKVLPRHLRFAIHTQLVQQVRDAYLSANPQKRIGIISDRSNALYSTQELGLTVPMEQNVEIFPEGENGRKETFLVVLAPTLEKVNTKGLQKIIQNMLNTPISLDLERLDRIYNTLMKNLTNNRYTPIGRSSLISFDDDGIPLGGALLNFKGYDATVEITNGWKPFLNVHSKI